MLPDNTDKGLTILEELILKQLERLQEGRANTYDRPNLHRVHPGSTFPPGFDENCLTRPPDQPPDPLLSLFEYHKHQIQKARAKNTTARLLALADATRDYEHTVYRSPAYLDPLPEVNSKDRDQSILRRQGQPAEYVAVMERCSFAYVRKVRRKNGQRMTDGQSLEEAA